MADEDKDKDEGLLKEFTERNIEHSLLRARARDRKSVV